MNCLENVKTFRSKGKVLFCWWSSPPSTSGHSIKITFLSSSVHISRSLPLTRNFINNVFIFQAPPPPTCSHAAAKYPQKIIAMRRYWIIIIAIPFNSFQLWSYNSIFGIRAKWVTTTSWNCFFFFFFGSFREMSSNIMPVIYTISIYSSLLCSSSTSLSYRAKENLHLEKYWNLFIFDP